jgi:hypothetical protein
MEVEGAVTELMLKQFGANEYLAGLVIGREVNRKVEVMAEWYSTGTVDGLQRDMSLAQEPGTGSANMQCSL